MGNHTFGANRMKALLCYRFSSMFLKRRVVFCLLFSFLVPLLVSSEPNQADSLFHYRTLPVFFEIFKEDYYDSSNLVLLPQQKLHIAPFGIKDVKGFTWLDARTSDYSWWLQMETLKYLLPLIESSDPIHNQIAKSWFKSWCAAHPGYEKPNRAAWDRMTAAIRAMVLVCYLKHEESRRTRDDLVIGMLRREIELHQRFLGRKSNFDANSNHGMWEALGLIETTRVLPDTHCTNLGLGRLLSLVKRSVSEKGIHKEHSPAYHFFFLQWLSEYTSYLESLDKFPSAKLETLKCICDRMKKASYYMHDHEGNMPTIGDTDAKRVKERFAWIDTEDPTGFCFDAEAGYAVFKDRPQSGQRRYIVFNIQNEQPELPYHFHLDALAVYFNCEGETILGDQGRYDYRIGGPRMFFVSPAAHNTIFPLSIIDIGKKGIRSVLAKSPWWKQENEMVLAGAWLSYSKNRVRRCLSISLAGSSFVVSDTLSGSLPLVLLWNIGIDVTDVVQSDPGNNGGLHYEWTLNTRRHHKFLLSIDVAGNFARERHAVEVLKGSHNPFLGWFAPSYHERIPTTVIKVQLNPSNEIYLVTSVEKIE